MQGLAETLFQVHFYQGAKSHNRWGAVKPTDTHKQTL
jgi:hypothetical protein